MAQINLTINSVDYVTLIVGGNEFTVTRIKVNENSSVFSDANYYRLPSNYGVTDYKFSTIAYREGSNPVTSSININEEVTSAWGSVKRTDSTHFLLVNGSYSTTENLHAGELVTILDIIESSDGVWFSRGFSLGSYFTPLSNWSIDFTKLFPVWTYNVSVTANNLNAPFTGESTMYRTIGEAMKGAIAPTDPYAGAGDSTTGGGDGTFDGSSDPVPVPSLPSVGAQDSGFITLFTPTASQMKDLAHYMWVNPLFDIETGFKKLFSDPMDCILGLSVVPVTIPTSGAQSVNIGNLVTSVTMNVASQQYIEVDCGTVTVQRFFGSYLDFEPYTKISLFLPYCGTHSLNMDDIAGKTIGIVYHIDILTGSCIAFVKCGESVLYEFNGACGSNIPVNSLNFASTIENAIRIAVNIGTTVATAGASAPAQTATEVARQKAMNTARNISLAGSTAEGALSLKPNVSRSGALGGGVGILGHQIPYFIITRPRLCKPANQDFFQGYPSFIQTTIGDLIGKGFTSFTNVIIAGQYLTDEEETELESILESGVYL